MIATTAQAVMSTVTGEVYDQWNRPVAGVNVYYQWSSTQYMLLAITNNSGWYSGMIWAPLNYLRLKFVRNCYWTEYYLYNNGKYVDSGLDIIIPSIDMTSSCGCQ